jgi:hypothetical protein
VCGERGRWLHEINVSFRVKKTSDFLVQLINFSPVGFGLVVFWSSCRLVELSFGRDGFGRVVGGRVVGGQVDGFPDKLGCIEQKNKNTASYN